MESNLSRRHFIQKSLVAGIGLATIDPFSAWANSAKAEMKLGLVTYQWAKDWDLPTIIANCEKTGLLGVELRVALDLLDHVQRHVGPLSQLALVGVLAQAERAQVLPELRLPLNRCQTCCH